MEIVFSDLHPEALVDFYRLLHPWSYQLLVVPTSLSVVGTRFAAHAFYSKLPGFPCPKCHPLLREAVAAPDVFLPHCQFLLEERMPCSLSARRWQVLAIGCHTAFPMPLGFWAPIFHLGVHRDLPGCFVQTFDPLHPQVVQTPLPHASSGIARIPVRSLLQVSKATHNPGRSMQPVFSLPIYRPVSHPE